MIRFSCPCGKALHAREDYAGQTTRCPQCDRELVIPGERNVQAEPPSPRDRPDEAVRRGRPGRGDDRDWEERPRPSATSGMAIASAILGVLALFACSLLTGLPALILGGISLSAIGRSEGRLKGKGLAITGLVTGGLSILLLPLLLPLLLFPAVQRVRESASKISSANNLKQIGIAMQDCNDSVGTLPPAAICNANGKPLLSWRVAILPYIEQENLYRQFKLDEPWDGPNNSRLIALMPKVYALPGDTTAPPGYTYYRVFVGGGAALDPPRDGGFPPAFGPPGGFGPPGAFAPPGGFAPVGPFGGVRGAHITDISDGRSQTILAAEAATAVPWTKPDELPFDLNSPLPALGGHFSGGFQVVMADGSVHFVSSSVSQATIRAAITRDANDIVGPDW